MQSSRDEVHITPAEWRWVILLSGILILVAFAPFLWVAASGVTRSQWQFMGILNNYQDGATYLSRMLQGIEGNWLIHFQDTPETHNPILFSILYTALGHLSQLINLSPIALFHVARVIASLVMYIALYHLGARIWPHKLRSRRMFFVIVAIGSGLGWFFGPLTGEVTYPDLAIPEIFPFYSSLVNVHFPLAIACIALMCSGLIGAFRPGMEDNPSVQNGGLAIGLLSVALSLLYPQSLVPLIAAVAVYVVVHSLRQKKIAVREVRWWLVLSLPALPMAAYYAALITYNPVAAEWTRQNVTLTPSPLIMILGLGIPLLIALPGIYQAVRRFEQDGDQLMLIWLVMIIVAVYLPTTIQRRFAIGLMIPIAYFATRALDGFWFQIINRAWRYRLLVAVIPLMTISYIFPLLSNIPLSEQAVPIGPFLPQDYAAAFAWLKQTAQTSDVILASDVVSAWIPAWVGSRVVYGHPYETVDAVHKKQQVVDWYAGTDASDCGALLSEYAVQYIISGPEEAKLGHTSCLDSLKSLFTYGSVTVYAP
jgi:hypothetical protein